MRRRRRSSSHRAWPTLPPRCFTKACWVTCRASPWVKASPAMTGSRRRWPRHPAPAELPQRPVGREFLYSSGTTGLPKGIKRPMVSWENRDAPDWDMTWKSLYGFDTDDGLSLAGAALSRRTAWLRDPPHHRRGRHRRGDGEVRALRALELIERYRITHSQWVPTMFVRLLALPEVDRRRFDLSSHRCAIHAAAPCPVGVKRRDDGLVGPDPVGILRGLRRRGHHCRIAAGLDGAAGDGRAAGEWRDAAHLRR